MADQQRPRMIRGCEPCRTAHAKCDGERPSCGRCSLLKRECVRGLPFPFRYTNSVNPAVPDPRAEFDFADDQIWVTSPTTNVNFVFEYMKGEAAESDPDDQLTTPSASGQSPGQSLSAPSATSVDTDLRLRSCLTPGESSWTTEHTANSSLHKLPSISNGTALHSSASTYVSRLLPQTPVSCAASPQHWPLADETEALLLRHFVVKLSAWFDYCDPQNSFATSVVQCAVTSPPLLYAIFAVSARHLSVTSGHDADDADRYHRQCLALLIPILDDSKAVLDESLYAATVILRLYEEISVPFAGQDFESHLMGTHTFVRAQDYHIRPQGIRQAAFRVVLRQEIVIAFRLQRPVQLLQEYIKVDRSLTGKDDWTLAFHILALCAEVLNYCYGEDPKTVEAWDGLAKRAKEWFETKPISYEPLLRRHAYQVSDAQVFPEMWLLNDCHVAAHQHYLICQILLAAHDPRRPQLGPCRAEAVEAANCAVRDHVRSICGIALSNAHCIPAMFTASLTIGMGGDLFNDYREQQAMMDVLIKTDMELAWPTASVQTYLRRAWGWDPS